MVSQIDHLDSTSDESADVRTLSEFRFEQFE